MINAQKYADEACDNCGAKYEKPADPRHDWTPCCSIECNGVARLREAGWTITQAFQVMHPRAIVRMVRNVVDAQEFESGLKALAKIEVERLEQKTLRETADMPTFCWWCGRKLQLPYFATVTDQLGHQQVVHKSCAKYAEKEFQRVTAQEAERNQTERTL